MAESLLDPCLEGILVGNQSVALPPQVRTVEVLPLGRLFVPTGRIVVCDPLTIGKPDPLKKKAPTGKFPVRLFIIHYEGGDQRIAAASLDFASKPSDRWEMAVWRGQDLATLKPGHIFGYGVDSGTGCFMDEAAARRLMRRMDKVEDYFEEILAQMEPSYVHTRSWALLDLGSRQGKPLNAAVFSSGCGDGFYASYWGWSGKRLARLVTDFDLLRSDS
jgi:hypothetical protein